MMDAAERALLGETVLAALSETADADGVLATLGWLDMLEAEPGAAIEVVFGALGTTNARSSAIDDVLARALGAEPQSNRAVLLPAFTSWSPPGRIAEGRIRAQGLASARAATAAELLIVCDDGRVAAVPQATAQVTAVHGIDPDAGFCAVAVDAPEGPPLALADDAWRTALAYGQRALAHELGGACRAMLELARDHALHRVQFGRPIARFQAVRHRLAETLVAIEALDAALLAASDVPGPRTAQLAKAIAGRTARTVAAHCQQVLAGIGFTTDHPLHRYLKRTILLDGIFGTGDDLAVEIGRTLVADRAVPTLIEL